MGNCMSNNVSSSPKSSSQSERDVTALRELFHNDPELLQLAMATGLLRDNVRSLCKSTDAFQKVIMASGKQNLLFSEKLRALAERPVVTGVMASIPEDQRGEEIMGAVEISHAISDLGEAQQHNGEHIANFVENTKQNLHVLKTEIEKRYAIQLSKSMSMYEKSFNQYNHRAQQYHKLATLSPELQEAESTQRQMSDLEADRDKAQAQMEAAAKILKRKANAFLAEFTPKVNEAVAYFAVQEHEALEKMADEIHAVTKKHFGNFKTARSKSEHFAANVPDSNAVAQIEAADADSDSGLSGGEIVPSGGSGKGKIPTSTASSDSPKSVVPTSKNGGKTGSGRMLGRPV